MYSSKKLILWTLKISSQIKHELTTLLTTAEAGYKTSIDGSDKCSCSFAEENRQNVGCTSSSRGLNVDKFLIRLINYGKSMFLTACIFLALPSHEWRKLAFGKWPIMRLDNFFLMPFNSRNATDTFCISLKAVSV